ncbi:hypothetical protein HY029_01745 [Candidatus Gottesmanbacteria bacterium]|nr:hypothetical protein [Candidatus Gottesmanbacteria bacterium]
MNKKSILIFGALSSFISVAIEICESAGFHKIYCVDNLNRVKEKEIDGYKVLQVTEIKRETSSRKFICCIHTPLFRQTVAAEAKKLGLEAESIIHKETILSSRATISPHGVLIAEGTIVSSHADISDFVLINRGVKIGHDVNISSFTTVESGAMIGGLCTIGEKSYIGMGAIILPKVKIGNNCLIAAGAVVRGDVSDNLMVAGVPAVVKKTNIPGYISEN